jgi:hypothetical protein
MDTTPIKLNIWHVLAAKKGFWKFKTRNRVMWTPTAGRVVPLLFRPRLCEISTGDSDLAYKLDFDSNHVSFGYCPF